ncbi:MAG: hypothetical protein KDD58_07175 [Bdellovibrionales bacterium]|nr:hypothetical protein [Bdellovibrionales bacterium]
MFKKITLIGILYFVFVPVHAKEKLNRIFTNAVIMPDAPKWLKAPRVEKITNRIQSELEWSTRRIDVYWYSTQTDFEKQHSLGPMPTAVTVKTPEKQVIHLGPKVTSENFDWIFGHELVHVISYQKYKGAIPRWLEEGLANHLAKKTKKVDYKWLAKQPFPKDVTKMNHPFKGTTNSVLYHYVASQALAEMLDKKCDLENLIRLSVERKMENYIVTYCEIKDLNAEFKKWVQQKSKIGF